MRQLPKAIPELDGGLFLPRPVVELLEAVLLERERALAGLETADAAIDRTIHAELRELLRLGGLRLPLPSARELLGLADPQAEGLRRNLLKG